MCTAFDWAVTGLADIFSSDLVHLWLLNGM
jgi:hypothetical protein